MTTHNESQTTKSLRNTSGSDFKILVLVLAAAVVCMTFMLIAGAQAGAVAASWQ